MVLYTKKMPSPIGELSLIAHDIAVVSVLWENQSTQRVPLAECCEDRQHPILGLLEQQLSEYFQQQRHVFDLPLHFIGTEFQQRVWQALLSIPYGETRSYQQIALQVGSPKAVRAVGAASGKNPLAILVPCHRVIGARGDLVGFAGGLEKKKMLLVLEQP